MNGSRPDEDQIDASHDKKQTRAQKAVAGIRAALFPLQLRTASFVLGLAHTAYKLGSPYYNSTQTEAERDNEQKRILKIISAIKGGMFLLEAPLGLFKAHSFSMIADSYDALQDMIGAGTSAAVHTHSPRRQALVALGKAGFMAAGAGAVLTMALLALLNPVGLPAAGLMAIVGGIGLLANTTCAALLLRHRNDGINMKSSWKSVRNDAFSNVGVLAVASIAHFFISPIPDAVVGITLAGLCIKSAVDIVLDARKVLREEKAKEKGSAAPSPSPKQQPKIILGLKNILHGFNRRAAAGEKAPVAGKPDVNPDEMPRYEERPKPSLRERTDGRAGASAAAPSAHAA